MPYHGTAIDNRGDPFVHRKIFGAVRRVGRAGVALGTGQGFGGAARALLARQPTGRRMAAAPVRVFAPLPSGARPGNPFPSAGRGGAIPGVRRRRRRINPGNTKALTRAVKRIDSFVTVAKKALLHTNYKLVTKQTSRSRSQAAKHHAT